MSRSSVTVSEFIDAESAYCANLDLIVTKFVRPLKDLGARGKLDSSMLARIVGNVEDIAGFHHILLAELRANPSPSGLAETFLKYAEYLKMYTLYVNNYDRCCDAVDALKSEKRFLAFLDARRADPECAGNNMMSFLIMPVQRLPLYEVLLEKLRKGILNDTSKGALQRAGERHGAGEAGEGPADGGAAGGGAGDGDGDGGSDSSAEATVRRLDEALTKVKEISTYVNERKRLAEDRSKLLDLHMRLSGDDDFQLLVPSRQLIKEGEMRKLSTFRLKRPRLFFLFNDLLLWTTTSYKIRGYIDMSSAQVCERSSHDPANPACFEIIHPAQRSPIVVYAKDADEKNEWIVALGSVIRQCIATDVRTKLRSRQMSLAMGGFEMDDDASPALSALAANAAARGPRGRSQSMAGGLFIGLSAQIAEEEHSDDDDAHDQREGGEEPAPTTGGEPDDAEVAPAPAPTSTPTPTASSPAPAKTRKSPRSPLSAVSPRKRSAGNTPRVPRNKGKRSGSRKNSDRSRTPTPRTPGKGKRPSISPRKRKPDEDEDESVHDSSAEENDNTDDEDISDTPPPPPPFDPTAAEDDLDMVAPPPPPLPLLPLKRLQEDNAADEEAMLGPSTVALRQISEDDVLELLDASIAGRKVCEAMAAVLGSDPVVRYRGAKPDFWTPAQDLLLNPNLVRLMIGHTRRGLKIPRQHMSFLKDSISNPLLTPRMVAKESPTAALIWNWVRDRYKVQSGDVIQSFFASKKGKTGSGRRRTTPRGGPPGSTPRATSSGQRTTPRGSTPRSTPRSARKRNPSKTDVSPGPSPRPPTSARSRARPVRQLSRATSAVDLGASQLSARQSGSTQSRSSKKQATDRRRRRRRDGSLRTHKRTKSQGPRRKKFSTLTKPTISSMRRATKQHSYEA